MKTFSIYISRSGVTGHESEVKRFTSLTEALAYCKSTIESHGNGHGFHLFEGGSDNQWRGALVEGIWKTQPEDLVNNPPWSSGK